MLICIEKDLFYERKNSAIIWIGLKKIRIFAARKKSFAPM